MKHPIIITRNGELIKRKTHLFLTLRDKTLKGEMSLHEFTVALIEIGGIIPK